jgi:hypothetical protein
MKRLFFIAVILSMTGIRGMAQPDAGGNNTCETAAPFCTGTVYTFPAGVNAGQGQAGPCYSCLATTPNPAWYYMRVANSGNIIIFMSSSPSHDIDFCCWGPFTSENCCTQLACNKVVSCSYSPNPTETCTIPNGVTGQYYMLVITNYSNQPCNITFSQTGGTGSTDCTILPPACSNNSPICAGQTLQLTANAVNNASYHWHGPAGFVSNIQNPTIANAQPVNSGDYYLRITVNGQPSADSSKTTAYVYKPVVNAGNDTTIGNSTYANLHAVTTGGSGHYKYHWEPAASLIDPNIQNPRTVYLFASQIFTVTSTDDSAHCTTNDAVTVNVVGGNLAITANSDPSTICAGSTAQLLAIGSGGTGSYTYEWHGPGGFTSSFQNPPVQPMVTSTYTVVIFDGVRHDSATVTVNVNQLPVADAGVNDTIWFGTYIYISGSASGGSGNYFYSWSPPDKLVNPNIQSPRTTNLTQTTVYTLTVTDLTTGCISNNNATVTVQVIGNPLNVNPVANPPMICIHDTTQLHSQAGGGNVGYYQHFWSSNPPGFSTIFSNDPNPLVHPLVNTVYKDSVWDGFNSVSQTVTVSLYAQPQIHLGPADTTVCPFNMIRIDAENPGSAYLWSNGETTRVIQVGSTGIGNDFQKYKVIVTNEHGCTAADSINLIFDVIACTGIPETLAGHGIRIYPNPSEGTITVEISVPFNEGLISVSTIFGQKISEMKIRGSGTGTSTAHVDLTDLPKGIYLIRFDSEALVQIEKLVIR